MSGQFEVFELVWRDRRVAVSYQLDWLQSGYCHIELRSGERLPVTETGYRSRFVLDSTLTQTADIATYVTAMLAIASEDKDWKRHLEDSRQLTLF